MFTKLFPQSYQQKLPVIVKCRNGNNDDGNGPKIPEIKKNNESVGQGETYIFFNVALAVIWVSVLYVLHLLLVSPHQRSCVGICGEIQYWDIKCDFISKK